MKKFLMAVTVVVSGAVAITVTACNNGGDEQRPFSVSQPALIFTAEGNSQDVTVTGGDWEAIPSAEWIEVTPAAGVDGDNFTVTVASTTEERNGNVTVRNSNTGEEKRVSVIQYGTSAVSVTGVELDKAAMTMPVGGTATLKAALTPTSATDQTVTWSAEPAGIVTVVDGVVKGVATGTVVVTVTTNDGGFTAECEVTVREPNVYVGGFVNGATGMNAAVWKNGLVQTICDKRSYVEGMYVDGKDVYAVGFEYDDIALRPRAMIWKNGIGTRLSTVESEAASVFVSEGDVYVAGYENNADNLGMPQAVVWKNGVAEKIGNGLSEARSIVVSGDDVYVVGDEQMASVIWKNGVVEILEGGSAAFSICMVGEDIYVAGLLQVNAQIQNAMMWKNGAPQKLSENNSAAVSISVDGSDVYVSGTEYPPYDMYAYAMIWKNGVAEKISTGLMSTANAVCAFGGNVYAAGMDGMAMVGGGAALWTNGVAQKIGPQGTNAYAIFVN